MTMPDTINNDDLVLGSVLNQIIQADDHHGALSQHNVPSSEFENAPAIPGCNFQNIISMLGGDFASLIEMLKPFLTDFQNYPNTITQLMQQGKFELAERLLHTFKGVSGNLGATTMSLASNALDSQLKQGYYEISTYEHWINETTTCMQQLSLLVKSFNPPPKIQDQYQLQLALENLDTLLQHDDFIDETLLSEIQSLLPADKTEQFTTMLKLIYATNYHAARVILKILKDY